MSFLPPTRVCIVARRHDDDDDDDDGGYNIIDDDYDLRLQTYSDIPKGKRSGFCVG